MRSTASRKLPIALLSAAIFLLLGAASAAAANPIPAAGVAIGNASLDWAGNPLLQGESEPHVGVNYFSAGVSDGSEGSYSAQLGNVAVYNVGAGGSEVLATYAARGEHTAAGTKQIVRLTGGVGRIEADGSAMVDWTGTFSVNFYAGLVSFAISDPELVVAADGSGELTGTIVGCEAGMSGCAAPLAPAPVTVANFSGVHVNPEEVLTVTPSYAGVEVETTGSPTPQNRSVTGWGAWPQSFVNYQIKTGLGSYWYSSGHNDALKAPLPFTVDFKGTVAKADPPVEGTKPTSETTAPPAGDPPAKPRIASPKGRQTLGANGVVRLLKLDCPSGGATCTTVVPKHLAARIGGTRFLIGVAAPKQIGAGKSANVRARLPKAAREALGTGKLGLAVPIVLKANGEVTKKTVKVTIAGRP